MLAILKVLNTLGTSTKAWIVWDVAEELFQGEVLLLYMERSCVQLKNATLSPLGWMVDFLITEWSIRHASEMRSVYFGMNQIELF